MKNTFSVRLPEDLNKQARSEAARQDRSLGSLVRVALLKYLDGPAPSPRKKASPLAYEDGFLHAWEEFPHFEGRSKKREAFAVWDRMKLEGHAVEVLDWIKRLKQSEGWTKDGGRFVPGMQAWLRGQDFSEAPGGPPAEQPLDWDRAKQIASGDWQDFD